MAGLTPDLPLGSTALTAVRQRLADDKSQQHDKVYQQLSGARHQQIRRRLLPLIRFAYPSQSQS